jgi:hypothetical protein
LNPSSKKYQFFREFLTDDGKMKEEVADNVPVGVPLSPKSLTYSTPSGE